MAEVDERTIGEIIFQCRNDRDLYIEDLCEMLSKTRYLSKQPDKATISKIERGKSLPNAKNSLALALVLDAPEILANHPNAAKHIFYWYDALRELDSDPLTPSNNVETVALALYWLTKKIQLPDLLILNIYELRGNTVIRKSNTWGRTDLKDTEWFDKAISIAQQVNRQESLAKFYFVRGLIAHQTEQYEEARQFYTRAEATLEAVYKKRIGDCWWYMPVQLHMALLYAQSSKERLARETFRKLKRIMPKDYDLGFLAYYYHELSHSNFVRRKFQRALRLARTGLTLAKLAQRKKSILPRDVLFFHFHLYSLMSYIGANGAEQVLTDIERLSAMVDDYTMYYRVLAEKSVNNGEGYDAIQWYIEVSSSVRQKRFFISTAEDIVARAHLNDGNDILADEWFEKYIGFVEMYGDSRSVDAALLRVQEWKDRAKRQIKVFS